ncbi:MAG TPA: tetratricopeptide repeat protein [Acidobacteriota bacterium]|nr:tetratricopeptide repeat protein [Acidobacteriota bacterium]
MAMTLLLALCLGLTGRIQTATDEDPLKINEEMKLFLEQNLDRSADSLEQLRTLVRKVFQENALNFKYVPETRTAIDTFSKRGGNCVSFTFLFLTMARYVGLDARFREVDIVPTWSQVGNIVSMNGHANVAVYIGGQGYLVDLFPRVDRIDIQGRVVLDGRAVAHFFNNKGVDQLGLGHQQTAVMYFRKALESDPTTPFVWANLGVAQAMSGELKEAVESYHKALQLNPAEMVAMSNLANLYERMGRFSEARSYKTRVRKFNQKNPYYHFNLGLQAYQSGAYKASIEHFRTAVRLKSAEHNFYLAMAKSYAQLGEMDRVESCLKQAAKYAPDEVWKIRYTEKLQLLAARHPHS